MALSTLLTRYALLIINTTEQSSSALTTAARNAAKDECIALWLLF